MKESQVKVLLPPTTTITGALAGLGLNTLASLLSTAGLNTTLNSTGNQCFWKFLSFFRAFHFICSHRCCFSCTSKLNFGSSWQYSNLANSVAVSRAHLDRLQLRTQPTKLHNSSKPKHQCYLITYDIL